MNNYDVIIIGAGPIGLACGLEAQNAGLSYLILEKGCLVNSLYNYPANMTFLVLQKGSKLAIFLLYQTMQNQLARKR
jgi:thioredoxin reductase